jgi:CheY-like chemotaxis protein
MASSPSATVAAADSQRGQAGQILLVEDDPSVAAMYRYKLESCGYAVRVAENGPTGLTQGLQSPPDLVLLDIGLPEMDGLQVLAALRADLRTRALPIVILSAYDDPELIERGRRLGATDHLVKAHVSPAQVSDAVARWIAALSAQQSRESAAHSPASVPLLSPDLGGEAR